jgi:cytoskeletal protein CcmA (bactofilin family)
MRFDLQLDPARVPHGAVPDAVASPLPVQASVPVPVLRAAVSLDSASGGAPAHADACGPVTWFQLSPEDRAHVLVVPAGSQVVGDLSAPAVWVSGAVTGRVRATGGALVVDVGGRVDGGVVGAGPVVVAGQVGARAGRAAVVAHGRLDLAGTARVSGDVFHGVVAVYEGAWVDGSLRAGQGGGPPAARR